MNPHDVRIRAVSWYALPVRTRVPLKFGHDTLTEVVCARVRLTVARADGQRGEGWGETPLSVQWVWPSALSYATRLRALEELCDLLTEAYAQFPASGHAMEIGHDFLEAVLPRLLDSFNASLPPGVRMPKLAALVCASAFDLALHDAYGVANEVPTYLTYARPWMNHDLAAYVTAAADAPEVSFAGKYPADFFRQPVETSLLAWHLVGGLDFLTVAEAGTARLTDGHPTSLDEWIGTDRGPYRGRLEDPLAASFMQPTGGMDRIPAGFTRQLEGKIKYRAFVLSTTLTERGVTVEYRQDGQTHAIEADYCFNCIPTHFMSGITNNLPADYVQAMKYIRRGTAYKAASSPCWAPTCRATTAVTASDSPMATEYSRKR